MNPLWGQLQGIRWFDSTVMTKADMLVSLQLNQAPKFQGTRGSTELKRPPGRQLSFQLKQLGGLGHYSQGDEFASVTGAEASCGFLPAQVKDAVPGDRISTVRPTSAAS